MIARLSNFISSIIKLSSKIWIIWNVVFKNSWWPFEMTLWWPWTLFQDNIFHSTRRWLSKNDKIAASCIFAEVQGLNPPDLFLQKYFGRQKFTDYVQNFFLAESSAWNFSTLKFGHQDINLEIFIVILDRKRHFFLLKRMWYSFVTKKSNSLSAKLQNVDGNRLI